MIPARGPQTCKCISRQQGQYCDYGEHILKMLFMLINRYYCWHVLVLKFRSLDEYMLCGTVAAQRDGCAVSPSVG